MLKKARMHLHEAPAKISSTKGTRSGFPSTAIKGFSALIAVEEDRKRDKRRRASDTESKGVKRSQTQTQIKHILRPLFPKLEYPN